MSTKPTVSLARFADTGSADVLTPPSGLRDTGFVAGTAIVQSYVNELFHQNYLWAQYLSDGALSGNHSIAGTLEVVSGLTVDADAVLAGAITIGGQLLAFTDFVFTAAASTDLLTDTAHPLHTGTGPVRVSNSGGALPGGLTAGTDYWAIRVDANTFKLATSFANSVAGVAIDITSNGTGTQTLLHQTGTTRATDATVSRTLTVAGNATVGGVLTASALRGVFQQTTIFPAALSTGNNNNWNPTGLATAGAIRLTNSSGGAPTITGITAPAAPADGRQLIIYNATGDTVTFAHADTNSSAANRLFFPGLASVTMATHQAWSFLYDETSAIWRPLCKNF